MLPLKDRVRTSRRRWLLAAVLFVATAALFSRCLGDSFVNYDDDVYVYANRSVNHGLTFSGLVRAFTQPHARNWHPLTTISHMIDCEIFGLNPMGHHAVNVALHALTAALIFLVLEFMTRSFWRAAFVAGVFAVHPLRVESVAWVAERKDVLCGLLFATTLLAYVRYVRAPDWRRLLVVTAVFAAGLMAKPMLVTVPVVLLLLDYWPLRRLVAIRSKQRQFPPASFAGAVAEKIPLFLLSAVSCYVTVLAARGPNDPLDSLPLDWLLLNAVLSCCRHISQLVWPANLAAFYPFPLEPTSSSGTLTAGAALVTVTAIVILLFRRARFLFIGWLWYLIMLVQVIGIIQVGLAAHADRYTYLPEI